MVKRMLGVLSTLAILGFYATVPAAAAGPGSHTAAEVNAAIEKGIVYFDANQNANGSWGSTYPIAETALALISYGVSDRGDVNNLSPARQVIVKKGIVWLLGQQVVTPGTTLGSWAGENYFTGLSLSALGFSKNGDPGEAAAISNGRNASIAMFQGPTHLPTPQNCSTVKVDNNGSQFCGGFTYGYGNGSADESNTGFGLTGLKLTGGIPAGLIALNTGWQHNIQELTGSGWATANDGGGSYIPGINSPPCCPRSNANDTGSMLFGYGYDGVPATDPGVVAGLNFAQDVLDVYELTTTARRGVYHTGATEDGSCDPAVGGCTWTFEANSEGGYHYSLWSLSKGLGEYLAPDLTSPTNWYAKTADLLLTQQNADGTWPVDGRDDATAIVSTGFSVFALGLAATPPAAVGSFAAVGDCSAVHLSWTNPNTSNYGGVEIRRRTDAFPTSQTDGTEVNNVPAPGTTADDAAVTNGTKYYYAAFPYDTTKQLFGSAATASATPTCPALPRAGALAPATSFPVALLLLAGLVTAGLGLRVLPRGLRS